MKRGNSHVFQKSFMLTSVICHEWKIIQHNWKYIWSKKKQAIARAWRTNCIPKLQYALFYWLVGRWFGLIVLLILLCCSFKFKGFHFKRAKFNFVVVVVYDNIFLVVQNGINFKIILSIFFRIKLVGIIQFQSRYFLLYNKLNHFFYYFLQ